MRSADDSTSWRACAIGFPCSRVSSGAMISARSRTVSYTHLDVYKRQVEAFAEVWTRTRQDIERNATKIADIAAGLATFEVDVVNFIRNG